MKKFLALTTTIAAMATGPVFGAQGLLELPAAKPKTIQQIGIVPETKPIELNLGTLRTNDPELPFVSTFKSRMKKRTARALQRQNAIQSAKRPKAVQIDPQDFAVSDLPEGYAE